MPLINLTHAGVFVDGLDQPEGIALGPDGNIYAGGLHGQIYRADYVTRELVQYASTGSTNLGLALDSAGNAYVCNPGARSVKKVTPEGEVSVYSSGSREGEMVNPNYPAFDSTGVLYVCDSGHWKADDGCIYAIWPGGETHIIDRTCAQFPNGCAVSPDGNSLYVAMSLNQPRVVRFAIEDGRKAGPVETVAIMPRTVPDGLAFCDDGSVLVACYRPDTIFRIAPDGDIGIVMDDYEGTLLSAPTNVCFAGPELSVLLWANLGRWHLGWNAHTGLRGAGVFYPSIPGPSVQKTD